MSAVLAGYIYPVKVDWVKILADIKATGCSRYRIAIILGVGQSTVQNWDEGHEPRYAMGEAILMLHAQLCPDATIKRCNAPEEPT